MIPREAPFRAGGKVRRSVGGGAEDKYAGRGVDEAAAPGADGATLLPPEIGVGMNTRGANRACDGSRRRDGRCRRRRRRRRYRTSPYHRVPVRRRAASTDRHGRGLR